MSSPLPRRTTSTLGVSCSITCRSIAARDYVLSFEKSNTFHTLQNLRELSLTEPESLLANSLTFISTSFELIYFSFAFESAVEGTLRPVCGSKSPHAGCSNSPLAIEEVNQGVCCMLNRRTDVRKLRSDRDEALAISW